MSQNKSPDGNRSEEKLTGKVYIKQTKRARVDTYFHLLVVLFLVSLFALGILTILRANTERQLTQTLWRLEKSRSDNVTLWGSVLLLQSENDDLNAQNAVLKTLTKSSLPICSTSTFKSWMDYRAITSMNSKQYKLQLKATTDQYYGFRMVDEYLMVAMGPQYGPVGSKYIIQFEDGKVIQAIIGDIKHEGCTSKSDGSALEFIIDGTILPTSVKRSGNLNSVFTGSITMIREVE